MPPQENTTPVSQFVSPVVAPLPKPHKAIWMVVTLVVGYVLSVLISVGIIGGMGIGCAFGNSGFMCNRLLPFSVGVGLLLVVILLAHISKSARKLAKRLYWIIFLAWVLLIGLIAVLPERARQTYVYGITREACEVGRPAVPWGYMYYNPDTCFSAVGDCMSMKSYSDYCFQKSTTQEITEIGQCDRFESGSSDCKRDFAIKSDDVSYCKELQAYFEGSDKVDQAWNRYSCAADVAFDYKNINSELFDYVRQRMTADTSPNTPKSKQEKYGIEFCGKYEGVQNDVCLFQASMQPEYTTSLCNEIQTDWLKEECVVYMSDKVN